MRKLWLMYCIAAFRSPLPPPSCSRSSTAYWPWGFSHCYRVGLLFMLQQSNPFFRTGTPKEIVRDSMRARRARNAAILPGGSGGFFP